MDINVYDALQERFEFIFNEFDNIFSFSGGKDSGLLLNLLFDYKLRHYPDRRRNGVSNYTLDKKTRVIFIGKIPDHTDDIKTSKDIPSWKRMCYCILKNDHTCRFMGFGLTRQEQNRLDMIKRKYGGILNE